jgi:hypothetical protein
MEKFIHFLYKKYGKNITDKLTQENRLYAENIRVKNSSDQKLVVEHLKELVLTLGIDLEIEESSRFWAFDFPGWIGELDFQREHVRKYMVIGLEPHIERFDFQITYGLSERTPLNNAERFKIRENNLICCEDDSDIIWTNLFNLFANDKVRKSVYEQKDIISLMEFLNQFYITDLCHFAPQGKAKAIQSINKWSSIRFDVAHHFIQDEIALINPEIVVTQGIEVFKSIKEILNINTSENYRIPVGKQTWNINVARKNKMKIICLPHIGSQMIHRTFWMRYLNRVKDLLLDNHLIL